MAQRQQPHDPPCPPSPLRAVWQPRSFAEFWPVYLREHSQPLTRHIHVAGTVIGAGLLVASFFGGPMLALVGVMVGYSLAWIAHFQVEGNRPATFGHPLWSLRGDLRMTALFLTFRLDAELRRHQIGLSSGYHATPPLRRLRPSRTQAQRLADLGHLDALSVAQGP